MLNEKTLVSPNEDFNFAEVCRAADYLQEATLNLGPYQLHPDPRIFQIYSYSWNLKRFRKKIFIRQLTIFQKPLDF